MEIIDEKIKEQIEMYMDYVRAGSYRKGKPWKGYEVYIPRCRKIGIPMGLPRVVLVKGDKVRLSSGQEGLEYSAFIRHHTFDLTPTDPSVIFQGDKNIEKK